MSTDHLRALLAGLARLSAAATPGTWLESIHVCQAKEDEEGACAIGPIALGYAREEQARNDARLIVALRNAAADLLTALPPLLAVVEALPRCQGPQRREVIGLGERWVKAADCDQVATHGDAGSDYACDEHKDAQWIELGELPWAKAVRAARLPPGPGAGEPDVEREVRELRAQGLHVEYAPPPEPAADYTMGRPGMYLEIAAPEPAAYPPVADPLCPLCEGETVHSEDGTCGYTFEDLGGGIGRVVRPDPAPARPGETPLSPTTERLIRESFTYRPGYWEAVGFVFLVDFARDFAPPEPGPRCATCGMVAGLHHVGCGKGVR